MDVSRFKQPILWLAVVACVVACAPTTPLAGTASAPGLGPSLTPAPTALATAAALATPTGHPLVELSPAVEIDPTAVPGLTPTPAPTSTLMAAAPAAVAAPVMPPVYWPTEGWRTSTPEEQALDSKQLERMFDAIDDQRLRVHSALVIRNGYIVAETYYPPFNQDTKHPLYSVTKSFISALVGIAIEQGYINGVEGRVVDFFPEREFANLDGRKAAMTLEHLLTMTSGLDWVEGMRVYQEMAQSRDWVKYVLDKPMAAEPGSQFNYCSGCSHVMSAIIHETTGMGTLDFAQSRLFEPLGISSVHWNLDSSGIPIGGWGLELTPRDMAKFGHLYLNHGVWDGQQVVPAEWVTASLTDRIKAGDELTYGYQWWLYPSSGHFAAVGLAAQLIYVSPELDIVVVFTAALDDSSALFELIDDYVVSAAGY